MGIGQFLVVPGIDQLLAVDPQANAVVGAGEKAIVAGRKIQGLGPAHRKSIGRNLVIG